MLAGCCLRGEVEGLALVANGVFAFAYLHNGAATAVAVGWQVVVPELGGYGQGDVVEPLVACAYSFVAGCAVLKMVAVAIGLELFPL